MKSKNEQMNELKSSDQINKYSIPIHLKFTQGYILDVTFFKLLLNLWAYVYTDLPQTLKGLEDEVKKLFN